VPDELVQLFLDMTEPDAVEKIDDDITRQCAYFFPGVVWAVGARGWPKLRAAYQKLATDDDWKTRANMAASIHKIAQIIGPELTQADLLHCFDAFWKDWDEVRASLLLHMAEFLALIPLTARHVYLPLLFSFKDTEESTFWRFRQSLAAQIAQLCYIVQEEEVYSVLCNIALELCVDPFASTRQTAYEAVSSLDVLRSSHVLSSCEFWYAVHFTRVFNFHPCSRSQLGG
ncbi:uncharacterized protein MONBRDRAFT_15118, partial [Monosiga brevicollis MX1]